MNDYQTTLNSFANFYGAVAQISGSLVGLVFVALTFNSKALGNSGHRGLRALALQVFIDFLAVLVLALSMLVPHFPPQTLGLVLVVLAMAGIIRIVRSVIAIARDTNGGKERLMLLQRFGPSLVGNTFLLIAGYLAVTGQCDGDTFWSLLISSALVLLLSGTRSAWLLVTHPQQGG